MKFGFFGPKLLIGTCHTAVVALFHWIGPIMYETHFGLNKRPFRALAAGTDVFVGPQTATAMAGLKKALASPDAIAAVSGPIGVGKTTIVRRALNAVGDTQVIISVGRMQLGHDEVLELLLEETGTKLPTGTVQRFTTFRRLLKEHADKGARVIIIVEDASRAGVDALSELEALTATDAGVSEGANIVLMGDQDMNEILKSPRLARLRQRLRLRQSIAPLNTSELTGYFKHCFRLAGNEFDSIFEAGSAEVLHRLSDGIPRMANNLVESSLTSAVENKLDRVNVAQIKLVASEEYGLDIAQGSPTAEAPPEEEPPEEEPPEEEPPEEEPPVAEPPAEKTPEPEVAADEQHDEIPELIQDTLPDLAILAPALVKPPEPEQAQEPPDSIPTLPASEDPASQAALEAAQVGSAEDEVPEWERDPTLAQLRPDLDALEHAMAVAQGLEPDTDTDDADSQKKDSEEPPERVPEITLDRQIQVKIDKVAEELRQAEEEREEAKEEEPEEDNRSTSEILAQAKNKEQHKPANNSVEAQFEAAAISAAPKAEPPAEPPAAPPVAPPVTPAPPKPAATVAPPVTPKASPKVTPPITPAPPKPAAPVVKAPPVKEPQAPVATAAPELAKKEAEKKPDAELEKIAVDLARAKTIDDCDDKMAETLFGEEFSMMAAEVAANAPPELSANDEDEVAQESDAVPVADFEGAAAINVEMETKPNGSGGHLGPSASQRLATVRALNASPNVPPPVAEPMIAANQASEPPPASDHPESIEDQINTSMTQTLKALSARPPEHHNDDDDDDEKGGFFSRFRRS